MAAQLNTNHNAYDNNAEDYNKKKNGAKVFYSKKKGSTAGAATTEPENVSGTGNGSASLGVLHMNVNMTDSSFNEEDLVESSATGGEVLGN